MVPPRVQWPAAMLSRGTDRWTVRGIHARNHRQDLLTGGCRVSVIRVGLVVGGCPAQAQGRCDRAGRNGCRAAPERHVPRRARERAQGARTQLGQDADASDSHLAGGSSPGRDHAVRLGTRAHHISLQVRQRPVGAGFLSRRMQEPGGKRRQGGKRVGGAGPVEWSMRQ